MYLKLIVNPAVSGTKIERKVAAITEFFEQNTTSVSLEYTTRPHEATILARTAADQNFDAVIAVGGDGTVNEVVNGIIGSQVNLGIIPTGSANDFAKALGLPLKTIDACKSILAANTKKVDVGKANDRYFVNVAGVGLDAQVSEAANKGSPRIKGLPRFTIALLKVLLSSHPKEFSLSLDNKVRKIKGWLISVGNGQQFGGGMKITPTADLSDGLFDICVIGDVKKWSVIYYLPLVVQGKHLSLTDVAIYRAKEVEVKGLGLLGHADGEVMKGDVFKFTLMPGALDVIVPANAH